MSDLQAGEKLSRRGFVKTAVAAAGMGLAGPLAAAQAQPAANTKRLNVVLLVADTFRRDHVGCYGCDWIKTPNLDRLAAEGVVFDRAYTGSYPTVPCRKDVMTGRWTFPWTGWSPLEKDLKIIPQVMRTAGYTTQFVLDTPHLIKDGYNFDRGWHGWHWVRGQETDRWMRPRCWRIMRRQSAGCTRHTQHYFLTTRASGPV